jgi:tRNA-dihydrouridine synthase B
VLYKNKYGVDGLMIGRAAIGYPWIFNEIKHFLQTGEHLPPPTLHQRLEVIRQHLYRSVEWKGPYVGITEMRRHYSNYLKGLPNIKEYRYKLVTLNTIEEIEPVLDDIQQHYSGFEFEKTPIQLINYHEKCAV